MAESGRTSGHSPSNIAHQLSGFDFPASRDDLVKHAKRSGSGEDATEIIEQMPERTYESMADVMKGVGEVE